MAVHHLPVGALPSRIRWRRPLFEQTPALELHLIAIWCNSGTFDRKELGLRQGLPNWQKTAETRRSRGASEENGASAHSSDVFGFYST